jgi:hypothetical protein
MILLIVFFYGKLYYKMYDFKIKNIKSIKNFDIL